MSAMRVGTHAAPTGYPDPSDPDRLQAAAAADIDEVSAVRQPYLLNLRPSVDHYKAFAYFSRAPRVGHKKSRKGCAQCKRRHVKCNEESPCSNCVRHGVACSLAGGPNVSREDARPRTKSTRSNSPTSTSRATSFDSPAGNATVSSAFECSLAQAPFTVLTALIDRPPPGLEHNSQLDLQLMHHYMLHTRRVLTERSELDFVMRIWQEELPRVAFSYDYVMHALLGFTALHKAFLEPDLSSILHPCAVDHLDKALVIYRRHGTPSTPECANAKFVFTWLVALFAYAVPPSVPPIDAVVELFVLAKGIDAALSETWFFVAQGPFSSILTRGFQEAFAAGTNPYPLPEGMSGGLGHLDFMMGVQAMLTDDRRTCVLVLGELKQIYESIRTTHATCSVASILCFPKTSSAAFADLIKRREPQALIILSYYCVLLDVLNDRWWMSGWASRVLTDVLSLLDEQWKHWIEWPCEMVLWKTAAATAASDPVAMVM